MSQSTYPRSSEVLLGGIAHLGRFIDLSQVQKMRRVVSGFKVVFRTSPANEAWP
ncbi:MAG: hypothetical protein OJF51_000475 [Nitrospira sp.]|nr:MAG: hypothetical protein OJF51_000475 [Nitrospira sp.]